jgi:hypothetical protein
LTESSAISTPSVQRVGVEEVAPKPRLVRTPLSSSPEPTPTPTPQPRSDPARFETALRGVIRVLSLRAILLLALIGAFVLAFRAMFDQSTFSLIALAIYCVCTVFPVAYLEIRRENA